MIIKLLFFLILWPAALNHLVDNREFLLSKSENHYAQDKGFAILQDSQKLDPIKTGQEFLAETAKETTRSKSSSIKRYRVYPGG